MLFHDLDNPQHYAAVECVGQRNHRLSKIRPSEHTPYFAEGHCKACSQGCVLQGAKRPLFPDPPKHFNTAITFKHIYRPSDAN